VHEVATLTGISQGTITKYENGDLKLSDEKAKLFAKVYKVETHELFLTLEKEKTE
jgi:transcriptional regulator with XRE-family HTH domain